MREATMTASARQHPDEECHDERMLIGGLVAFAAHEADRTGDPALSRKLEEVFIDIAQGLPTGARKTLLMMSHEIALRDGPPERVKLYLVKS
jgi:hypothetical protein